MDTPGTIQNLSESSSSFQILSYIFQHYHDFKQI